MSDLSDEEIDAMNYRALGALIGFSKTGAADLVALLRSDAPISWPVRNLMADAIEGSSFTGVSLDLKGHEASANRVNGLTIRRGWLDEGRTIIPIVEAAPNVSQGFFEASERTGKKDDLCRKRYYYAKNFSSWADYAVSSGGLYSKLPPQILEDLWHLASFDQKADMRPVPLPPDEYDALIAEQARFLRQMAPASLTPEAADSFVQTMMHYMMLLPPPRG